RAELARLPRAAAPAERHLPTRRLAGREAVLAAAHAAITAAEQKMYLSGRAVDLEPLAPAVAEAGERGVRFVLVHFGPGPLPFKVPRGGRAFRHASTEGQLYPSHRAHHLALVADSR